VATFDTTVLRRPRWIIAVVVAGLLTLLFVRLGIWQLDRLEERRNRNAAIEAASDAAPAPFGELVARYGLDPVALDRRPAIVTGIYRTDLEFVSVGRTVGDATGTLLLTPIELDDGSLMVVVRGIVPPGTPGPPAEGFEPPAGEVIVTGRLDDGEEPLRIGEPDPEGGVLTSLSRVDLGYVDRWIDGDVLPVSIVLAEQVPANAGSTPIAIPPEELTEGSHLGYAIQWFGFAIVVLVGVAFLVWRAGTKPSQPEHVGATVGEGSPP
jgi:cytochrome oxidase assembly protein ShyY1